MWFWDYHIRGNSTKNGFFVYFVLRLFCDFSGNADIKCLDRKSFGKPENALDEDIVCPIYVLDPARGRFVWGSAA